MNLSFANAGASPLAVLPDSAALAVAPSTTGDAATLDVQTLLFGMLAKGSSLDSAEPAMASGAEQDRELETEPDQVGLADMAANMTVAAPEIPNFLQRLASALSGEASGQPVVEQGHPPTIAFKQAAVTSTLPSQAQAMPQLVAQAAAAPTSGPDVQTAQNNHAVMPDIQARQNTVPVVFENPLKQAIGHAMHATPFRMTMPNRQSGETPDPRSAAPASRTPTVELSSQTSLAMPLPQMESIAAKAGAIVKPSEATSEQKLLGALGERISVQASQGIHHAVIRLDPHMSGSVRIELRHEAGVLQVRISASQAEVTQQLQAIGDGLRQELNNRQFNDVTVQIAHGRHAEHGGRGGQQQPQDSDAPYQQAPGRALAAEAADEAFDAAWKRAAESRGYNA